MNIETWTTSPAWTLAGWTMLHFFWVGAAILALAAIGRRALRGAHPDVRHAFALAALAATAVAPIVIAWTIAERPRPAPALQSLPTVATAPPAFVGRPSPAPTPPRAAVVAIPSPAASPRLGVVDYLNVAAKALPGVWLLGAPWTFAYLVAGLLGAERIRRRSRADLSPELSATAARLAASLGVAGRVAVGVCDRIAGPILVGIARPLILLPAAALSGWSPAQVELALLHELAHVRRRDNLVNLLQRLVESALFFHPAVWILSGWVRREREHCCDRIVVDRTGRALDYAGALFALADSPDAPLAHGAFMARNHLADRVRRILGPEETSVPLSRSAVALAASTVAVPAILFAAYSQKSSTPKQPPKADRPPAKSNPAPAGAWTTQELHDWIRRAFLIEPETAALIREIIKADEDYLQTRVAGRPDADPAVKAAAERRARLRTKYDALWTERYDEIRRRAPAPVVEAQPVALELESRIQSLFRSEPAVWELIRAVMAVDQDLDRFSAEGRDRRNPDFTAARKLRSKLTARYDALWTERYDELRRRVLENLKDGAPDDLEARMEGEFQRDPEIGPLLSNLQEAERQILDAWKAGRDDDDPALAAMEKRWNDLWARYDAAWKERHGAFRRRLMTGADEFAPWRIDVGVGDLFRQAPEVAALYEAMSAADLEAQNAKDDDARQVARKRKAELEAKSNALWTERYPKLHKWAVAVLLDQFTPRPPQPEQKAAENRAFAKMAILPGSPELAYFAPIPETIACHVSGMAKDERGEPVAGAHVTVYAVSQHGAKPAAETATDAQGRYEFRGVRLPVQATSNPFSQISMPPRIQFRVSAQAPGEGAAWRQGWSMWQYNPQNLADDRSEGHLFLKSDITLDLTLRNAAALHGKIVDEDGKPIPGATIRIVEIGELAPDGRHEGDLYGLMNDRSPDDFGRATTADDGGFRIEGLSKRCCYELAVARQDSPHTEYRLHAATGDGPDQEHHLISTVHVFILGPHLARMSPIKLTMPKPRPVEVSVVGEDDGAPVARARLKATGFTAELQIAASGETDAEGKLRLDLPPSEQMFVYSTPPEPSRYLPTGLEQPLVVKAGDSPMPLEIRQKVGAELILEAVEAGTGEPVPDVFFWWTVEGGVEPKTRPAEDVSGVLLKAWTDEQGVLRAAVAPAPGRRYRFHFGGMREPITGFFTPESPRTYGYEASPAESVPVELVPGKPIRLKFALRKGPPDPNPYRPRPRAPEGR